MKKVTPTNFIEEAIVSDIKEKKLKKIITRFPPEPNGYMHIGHVKALCIDFLTAKKFGGYTNLRMDDTNPSKEDNEYVEGIKNEIKWLGFKWKKLKFASEYYEKLYKIAEKMIINGDAYVCDLSADEVNKTRGTLTEKGTESPYRNRSVNENLGLFRQMRAGKFKDGEKTLRAKIDMSSPNINMRDPIMYRISHTTHHRTGDKWCIYPMYDFAHPISDAIEGITHSLCSLEFEDHRPLYDWFVNKSNCFKNKPRQIEFARLNINRTVMSKRFLRALVEKNIVSGWDDPRMPTLCGMRRRGYPAEAIIDFVLRCGVAKANSLVEPHILEACVREKLNETAKRVMVVLDPLKIVITNHVQDEVVNFDDMPNGKSSHGQLFTKEIFIEQSDFMENADNKFFRLKPDGYVRLKGAYIIKCDEVVKDKNGKVIKLKCSLVANSKSGNDTSGMKVKGTIHWVSASKCVNITVRKYDYLLKEGVEFNDNYDECVNDKSILINKNAVAELEILSSKINDMFQFMRNGYYILDKDTSAGDFIFNETISLKSSF